MLKIVAVMMVTLFAALNFIQAVANTSLKIEGKEAKNIYQSLTGSTVQNEGAAGHLYRAGKNILCRYTDVDMDDNHGNSIPINDARRYMCSIKFDNNGLASPGGNP